MSNEKLKPADRNWDLTTKLQFNIETGTDDDGDFITDLRKKLLLIIAKKLDGRIKDSVARFCKVVDIPHQIVDGLDNENKYNDIRKAYNEYDPEAILIIGNISQFTGNFYKTQAGRHYSDNVFQDPEQSGTFTTPVGRVSGDIPTIMYHLLLRTGNTNKAAVFLPESSIDNELAIEGIQKLGLDMEIITDYTDNQKKLLEEAEIIFQYSNSQSDNHAIHGTLSGWITKLKTIFDSRDLLNINFQNYPIVFSQACNTGNFGTFAQQMLRSRACFFGSSSPTYTFKHVEFRDWENVPSSDGWKIGFLDLLDEKKNIGEIKIEVENRFIKILNSQGKEYLESFKRNQVHRFLPEHSLIVSTIQFQLFGNPLRFSTVGLKPDFDIEEVK
ncbi:MAG: C25 family cysteine peptidase [Candidatus Heimdallarchaeaceae archaeon]